VEQATPGDAGSRAENPRAGPTGRTRAGGSRAGMLAEPKGARARNAWGPIAGRARPTPAGGPNRSKGQNVQVSLRLSVCGTQDELGPPAGSSVGRARPAPAGGPNRSKGQNVQVSLRLSVSGTQDELGPPAGPSVGRARPAPAGGPNRAKGQNVQVSLRLSVWGTQDELGPPAGPGRTPGRRFAPSTRRDILAISGSN